MGRPARPSTSPAKTSVPPPSVATTLAHAASSAAPSAAATALTSACAARPGRTGRGRPARPRPKQARRAPPSGARVDRRPRPSRSPCRTESSTSVAAVSQSTYAEKAYTPLSSTASRASPHAGGGQGRAGGVGSRAVDAPPVRPRRRGAIDSGDRRGGEAVGLGRRPRRLRRTYVSAAPVPARMLVRRGLRRQPPTLRRLRLGAAPLGVRVFHGLRSLNWARRAGAGRPAVNAAGGLGELRLLFAR